MVDNRIFEKQARELLANYNTIYFYIVTNKKNLIERKIQKVSDAGVYSDIYTRYRARFHDDININKFKLSDLIKVTSEYQPALSVENCSIYDKIESLLKAGYIAKVGE